MEFEKIKDEKNYLEFNLINSNETLANTIRRTIITSVPVFAADKIEIIENDSPMYDETIAHRIAMIPFTYSDNYIKKDKCECKGKGCNKCTVTLIVKKKGKANVYSGDFKSSDKNIVPVSNNILITKLEENMNFEIEISVILGTQKEHSKFQNSIASFSYDNPDKITFKIKSISGRNAKDILLASIDILKEKLSEFENQIRQKNSK